MILDKNTGVKWSFQFQAGSIKGGNRADVADFESAFQFQAGSIKGGQEPHHIALQLGFNSRLVRLKESPRRTRRQAAGSAGRV